MRKSNRGSMQARPEMTVGIDLGDRFSRYCMVNGDGEVIEEGRMRTTGAALERHFAGEARQRIALECGTHSPWVSRLLAGGPPLRFLFSQRWEPCGGQWRAFPGQQHGAHACKERKNGPPSFPKRMRKRQRWATRLGCNSRRSSGQFRA